MQIIRNSAMCTKCGDEIESTDVHHFQRCYCGAIAVDGGKEYLKRAGNDLDHDLVGTNIYQVDPKNIVTDDNEDYRKKFIIWSPSGKTNPQTVFERHADAQKVASGMTKQFNVPFFVCQINLP